MECGVRIISSREGVVGFAMVLYVERSCGVGGGGVRQGRILLTFVIERVKAAGGKLVLACFGFCRDHGL